LTLAVLSASAVLLAGQQTPPPQTPPPAGTPAPQATGQAPTFKSSVEVVRLDVSVLDSGRVPVEGLTANDFTVLEEGRPQKITTFSEVSVPDPVEPTTAWMRDVSPDIRRNDDMNDRRLILIVIDDAMMSSMNVRFTQNVKTAATQIVEHLGPSDLCAVIYTMDSRNMQEFTNDRAKILAAIDRYAPGFGGDQELFERYSVNTLLRAAEYLTEIPQRRKALFYISTGIAVNLEAAAAPVSAGLSGTGGDPVGRAAYLMEQMQDVFRQAQIANVNIHAVDPSALEGNAFRRAFDTHKDFLFTVSENTGGFPIINRDDYDVAVGQVFLENSSYYLLGYEPDKPNDGRYRRIEVRVNRPGLTVRTRSGYYAPEATKAVKASAGLKAGPSPLWTAISGLLPVGGLPLQVTAAPFASPNRKEGIVAVALGIVQDVDSGDERKIEHVDFLVDAFGQDGSSKSVHGLKADVALKPGVKGKVGYEVLTRITLKPGRYQLRLSAHLPSQDLSGSIYYDVDVPDFSKGALALSGIMLNAAPALASAPRGLLLDLMPAPPTSNRYFRQKADRVQAFVRVYQPKGGVKPVDLHTRVTDSVGAEILNRVTTIPVVAFGKTREASYSFAIPVSALKPGAYLLTFDAGAGRDAVRRDVRFNVQ
jgi:VWFA-related protein